MSAVLALMLTALLALTACTGTQGGGGTTQGDGQAPESDTAAKTAKVSISPESGSQDVAPRDEVSVSVTNGTIKSVTLTNGSGEKVEGTLAQDQTSWSVAEPLGYGKTYTFSGEAASAGGGKTVPIEGSFGTITPKSTIGVSSNVGDDQTYGIAMPIALTFDSPVENKAAVEEALHVETTPENVGSWAWMHNGTSVHWRPKDYWKPQTDVSVRADLYGVPMGGGAYGANDLTMDFSIGRSQIVKANTQTHRMVVYRDGEKIADYPASFGLESDPVRVTRSGIHVVMAKHQTYFMTNPGYGYEDFEVKWAVRVSNNGEFTHAAPWSVQDQGQRNVSHGCVNLAPDDAEEYYKSALQGDPVEVEGSSVELAPKDGDYHDWIYSWEEWTSMSALDS